MERKFKTNREGLSYVSLVSFILTACLLFQSVLSNVQQSDSIDGDCYCVAGNQIYLAHDKVIYVLELETGRLSSTFKQPDSIVIGPVFSGGSLVFCQGGAHTSITASDPVTGKQKWTVDHRTFLLRHRSGVLYVNDQINDSVHAFRIRDGKQLWCSQPGRGIKVGSNLIITPDDHRLFTTTAAIDQKTGTVVKRWGDAMIIAGDYTTKGVWLVNSQNYLFQLNNKNEISWGMQIQDCDLVTTLKAKERYVLITSKRFSQEMQRLMILDTQTHQTLWEERYNLGKGWPPYLAISDENIFLVVVDKKSSVVIALNPMKNQERWRYMNNLRMASPLIVGDILLVRTTEGLIALNSKDGTERWHFTTK